MSGYFDSFCSIMDCYEKYRSIDASRAPSLYITYSGECSGSVKINYVPVKYDNKHCYTDRSLCGAPIFTPFGVTRGAMVINSIKTKENGLKLTWESIIDANDVENLEALTKSGDSENQEALLSAFNLYAIITSTPVCTKENNSNGQYIENDNMKPICIRSPKNLDLQRSSSGGELQKSYNESIIEDFSSVVENTVPVNFIGEEVSLVPTNIEACAPALEKSIYIQGKMNNDIVWDKPKVCMAIKL